MLPIYQAQQVNQQAKLIFDKGDDSHCGLWFERFYDYLIYDENGELVSEKDIDKLITDESADEQKRLKRSFFEHKTFKQDRLINYAHKKSKTEFFKSFKFSDHLRQCGNLQALESYAQRQATLCKAQKGQTAIYQNDWLMAIGLGNSHPLENGLLWHPTLGVPYFQGSTVKGLAKALMEKWGADPEVIKRWFGSVNAVSKKDDRATYFEATFGIPLTEELQKQFDEQSVGDFIFLDAIPVEPVMLKQSIMTPHYGDWYQKGDEKPTDKDVQPGDWHSPIPVGFLAVEKAVMQFGVMPRLGAKITDDELEQVNNVIALALEHLGIGAKTATGYGRMK